MKAKTTLHSHSSLTARKPLTAKKTLSSKHSTSPTLKSKPYKPQYPYASIFTDDLKTCYISGRKDNVEIHHIFGAGRKHFSEKYHFILPLTAEWHKITSKCIHLDRELDLKYKRLCQEYWLNTLHKTKEEWIAEADKWW